MIIKNSLVRNDLKIGNKLSDILKNKLSKKKLYIPKKWSNVQIIKDPKSHIQVVARDKNGKKQYIYNPKFTEITTKEKFKRIQKFCLLIDDFLKNVYSKIKNLYKIETKEDEICLLFYILSKTYFRIGNESYNTYGLTTLEKKHIILSNTDILFDFIGKKSVRNYKKIKDPVIYRLLFDLLKNKSKTNTSNVFSVSSLDMNNYLSEKMSPEFTCKDFRTYYSNVLFIKYLCTGHTIKEAYEKVSKELCHTKLVSKKSYVMSSHIEKLYNEKRYLFNNETLKNPKKIIVMIKL